MIKTAVICAIGFAVMSGEASAQADTYSSVSRHGPGDTLALGLPVDAVARCSWKKNYKQALAFVDGYFDGMSYEDVKPLWNEATKGCNLPLGKFDDWEIHAFSNAMDTQHPFALIKCVEASSPSTLDAFRNEFKKADRAQLKAYVKEVVHTSDSSGLLACDSNMDNPKEHFSYRRASFLSRLLRKSVWFSQNIGAQHATELS